MIAKNNAIHIKSYAFAIRIVNAYKFLAESEKKFVLSKQLLRSGTAIGALVAEAHHAQSGADFLNMNEIVYQSISSDCNELVALLVCIVKSMKDSLKK